MCGIVGLWEFSKADVEECIIVSMVDALRHRGPDGHGFWRDKNVVLGQTRLSIIDLTPSGRQPMLSSDGRYILTFNGEIYNYKTLAHELHKEGVVFEVTGDTRVLLEACAHWGVEKTLPKLNGMFAFGFYDKKEELLFVARDRFGEKPLYYTYDDCRFAFASELKALKRLPGFNTAVDENALALYLRLNYIPCPYSIYKNCKKLFPGHYLKVKFQSVEDGCYYDLASVVPSEHPLNMSEQEIIDVLDEKLRKSVRERMVSDVPLGAFLSGGIDSSLVVALMQAQSTTPVKTFTVGFKDSCWDEAKYAEKIADYLGTDHTTVYISPEELYEDIYKIVDIYDEPFGDSSALPVLCISKYFKKHVSVALGGDGGDELFLGYYRHKWVPLFAALGRKIPNFALDFFEHFWNFCFSRKNPVLSGQIVKALRSLKGKNFFESYLNSVSYWSVNCDFSSTWFRKNTDLPDDAEQVAWLDLRTFLHDDVLCKVDRASMAVGLETRAPFLDHELVDFVTSIPLKIKFRNHEKKHLLKYVLNKYVPKHLWERPKMGFGMPLQKAFRTFLKSDFEALLKQDTMIWKFLDKNGVRLAWDKYISNRCDSGNSEGLLWNFWIGQRFLSKL